ncbi:hypothetical protein CGRA01v4_03840 [Colletotrichum graminicola]|nr:hypothetical protein CGRA01v4_03840 [Colletotrichum graminicola]
MGHHNYDQAFFGVNAWAINYQRASSGTFAIQYPAERGFPCAIICARALGLRATEYRFSLCVCRKSRDSTCRFFIGRTAPPL